MSRRLLVLLGVLFGTALLIWFDSPEEELVVEASAPRRHSQPPRPVTAPVTALVAAPVQMADVVPDPAAPLPDLFAGGANEAAAPEEAPEAPESEAPTPFTLIGFKEEGGLREAFLAHGDAVLLARAGTTLEKRYRVLALHQQAVDIRDQHTGKQYRIAFEEEQ